MLTDRSAVLPSIVASLVVGAADQHKVLPAVRDTVLTVPVDPGLLVGEHPAARTHPRLRLESEARPALLGIPVGRMRATVAALLRLLSGPPQRLLLVVLIPAQELAVRNAPRCAVVHLQGELA